MNNMKQIIIIIFITAVIAVVIVAVLRANPTPAIPDGVTEEEHESHHTNSPSPQ